MNIPRYWEKVEGRTESRDGTTLSLIAWGWSADDSDQARRKAEERLQRMIERVQRGEPLPGKYPYGANALREEIIEEVHADGDVAGIVTRNGYGSLVLNSKEAMFIDIDQPPGSPAAGGLLGGLFGRKKAADEPVERIAQALSAASDASFRIYKTAGGFRVMGTDRTFEPGSSEAEQIMNGAGADPSYVQLCKAQRSFRARLQPKPWRCGMDNPPGSHPRDRSTEPEFRSWLSTYEKRCGDKAVCQFVKEVGTGRVSDSIAPLLEYHDNMTKATSGLPLA